MITREHSGKGGPRENSGRKSEGFRKKCAELASSPKFFAFAKRVFDGEAVEERIAKDGGTIFIQASCGDRVYLWEKLAAYGFGKPASEVDAGAIAGPIQKLINDVQALKLLQELNFANRSGNGHSQTPVVGSRDIAVSAAAAPVRSV